jgi:hypothetical protein
VRRQSPRLWEGVLDVRCEYSWGNGECGIKKKDKQFVTPKTA